ncbi:unnamed protein product [Linum trigynum]|uniref:Wall-associated receptor kinase C-terminal domain-containing protein n=1 Tax=Linum trigynum TaxID=586398 RepID=A0AAV2DN78_9ROSI
MRRLPNWLFFLCYPPRNTTLDPSFFDFAPDTQFALLYYYCPPPQADVRLPPSIGQFNYSSGPGGYFLPSEYLLGEFEDFVRSWSRSCVIIVRMSTDRTELGMPANQTEQGIRRRQRSGDYEDACRNCKGSGGKCGFDEMATRSFVCYCSDQAYASDCLSLASASPPEKALDELTYRGGGFDSTG